MSAPYIPQIRLYQNWLREQRGLEFSDYDALWRWSTTDLDAFWQSIWDYFDLQSPTPHAAVLAKNTMPGAQWFPGAQVNYAERNANPYNHTASTSSPRLPMRRCASSLQIRPYQACEIAYIALTA